MCNFLYFQCGVYYVCCCQVLCGLVYGFEYWQCFCVVKCVYCCFVGQYIVDVGYICLVYFGLDQVVCFVMCVGQVIDYDVVCMQQVGWEFYYVWFEGIDVDGQCIGCDLFGNYGYV